MEELKKTRFLAFALTSIQDAAEQSNYPETIEDNLRLEMLFLIFCTNDKSDSFKRKTTNFSN